jgi:ribonuclease HII
VSARPAAGDFDVSRVSLAQLRAQLEAGVAPQLEERLLEALRGDARRGARALAERFGRRAQARRAEAQRLARLFALRGRLLAAGARHVAGVDEVGVGPLAGPVVAAAVVLPPRVDLPGLGDSKQLSRSQRERLDVAIRAQALAVAVEELPPSEVDRLNVLRASLEAMRRAVEALGVRPDHVLVDARTIPAIRVPQTSLVKGDTRDGSIAAASIVAKVYRDAIMRALDARHPGYGFARNKGYPTPEHLAALGRLGPAPVHRRSFAPVAQLALV